MVMEVVSGRLCCRHPAGTLVLLTPQKIISSSDTPTMSPSPVIILTGASRGLGLSVLKILLSRYNARVSTLARSYPPELKAVEEEYGQDRLLVIQGDAGKVGDNQSVVQRTVEKWGAVDGIVMNAGNMNLCAIHAIKAD